MSNAKISADKVLKNLKQKKTLKKGDLEKILKLSK